MGTHNRRANVEFVFCEVNGVKLEKAERRDAKIEKRRNGMRMSGRSTKTLLPQILEKKSREARRKRLEVEKLKDKLTNGWGE